MNKIKANYTNKYSDLTFDGREEEHETTEHISNSRSIKRCSKATQEMTTISTTSSSPGFSHIK